MRMSIKRDAIAVDVDIHNGNDEYQLVAVRPSIIITDEDRVKDIFVLTKTEWEDVGSRESGPKLSASQVIVDFELDFGQETNHLVDKMFAGNATHDDVMMLIKGGMSYASFLSQMSANPDVEQDARNI